MIQRPLHNSRSFHVIFSTKRQKYLTDRDTWTDQIRLCNRIPQGGWIEGEGESEYIREYYDKKFPEEMIEIKLFQLQYVEIN